MMWQYLPYHLIRLKLVFCVIEVSGLIMISSSFLTALSSSFDVNPHPGNHRYHTNRHVGKVFNMSRLVCLMRHFTVPTYLCKLFVNCHSRYSPNNVTATIYYYKKLYIGRM